MESQEIGVVNFYMPEDQYGEFSNVYISPFTQNQAQYQSNQHYFQSKKFQGTQKQLYVRSASTPNQAFDRGNQRTQPIRADWNQVKELVMKQGLRLKFTQNPHALQKLLSTGQRQIVEHTVNDSYWGDGGNGSGKNRLGIILMELREQLKQL